MNSYNKKHKINTGTQELELTKNEIYKIIDYYQKNVEKIDYTYGTTDEQMILFYQYYTKGRSKKSVFIQISLELNLKWKSVQKTYLKYRTLYE